MKISQTTVAVPEAEERPFDECSVQLVTLPDGNEGLAFLLPFVSKPFRSKGGKGKTMYLTHGRVPSSVKLAVELDDGTSRQMRFSAPSAYVVTAAPQT